MISSTAVDDQHLSETTGHHKYDLPEIVVGGKPRPQQWFTRAEVQRLLKDNKSKELPAEFRSGNDIPVERATITRARMAEILGIILEE